MAASLDYATKICTKCGETKALTDFIKNGHSRKGTQVFGARCQPCRKRERAIRYTGDRERIIAKARLYHSKNREKCNAAVLKRHYENRQQKNADARAWYWANRDRAKSTHTAWSAANPEARRAHEATRRAKLNSVGGSYGVEDIRDLMALQNRKCPVCKTALESGYHVDHITPLSRAGRNDKTNLQLLCQPCNQSKHNKDPIEFMQSRGLLL